ncbi:cytochrome P450 [Nonomuraea sp. NPDC059023]|uniref:cytochrome P450 family protein n=1 Tax=unclassified Nonomuraea TaxID=2593643 RepID=UPI00368DD0AD
MDDGFYDDPHSHYIAWRSESPVLWMDQAPGGTPGWLITGYAEGRAALADPALSKANANVEAALARHGARPMISGQWLTQSMINCDPPDHTRLRRLAAKAFSPKAIDALRPRIAEITESLLDGLARDGGVVDLMARFAGPLPITVICEILGVVPGERGDFEAWTDTLIGHAPAEEKAAATAAMVGFLSALVAAKRADPGEDMLSTLVQARDEGDALTERELIATAFLLLVAGYETTVNLICNALNALFDHPDQLAALRTDPSLVPGAVEEFLRFDGPVGQASLRVTTAPVSYGGVKIPAGEVVHVSLLAANRDPARFTEAGALDVRRPASGHLGFGHGIHHCLGAPLARMEAEIAFTALLARFPAFSRAPGRPPVWMRSDRLRGLRSLWVDLGPPAQALTSSRSGR